MEWMDACPGRVDLCQSCCVTSKNKSRVRSFSPKTERALFSLLQLLVRLRPSFATMDHEEETPRERFMGSQEILSTIEWVDVLMDHNESLDAIALFDMHIACVLRGNLAQTADHLRHTHLQSAAHFHPRSVLTEPLHLLLS